MSVSLRTTNRQQKKVLPRPGSQLSKTLTFFFEQDHYTKKASVGQVGWLNKSRVSFLKCLQVVVSDTTF